MALFKVKHDHISPESVLHPYLGSINTVDCHSGTFSSPGFLLHHWLLLPQSCSWLLLPQSCSIALTVECLNLGCGTSSLSTLRCGILIKANGIKCHFYKLMTKFISLTQNFPLTSRYLYLITDLTSLL